MDYPFWQQAIPLTMIFVIFFVVVIRPPRTAEARRFRAVMAASANDRVVTSAGFYGRIIEVGSIDQPFLIEIAEGVNVQVAQDGIRDVVPEKSASGHTPETAPETKVAPVTGVS